MPDIRKVIENPDSSSPGHIDREIEMSDWDKDKAIEIAKEEGIILTQAHWEVVNCLRNYYMAHGQTKSGRVLADMLDKEFASQGGSKYLYRLFPDGPVSQGMRISGLPLPPYTEDGGFGSSL
jgi:tRNA 2-thiouridine synthesizing protein E